MNLQIGCHQLTYTAVQRDEFIKLLELFSATAWTRQTDKKISTYNLVFLM